MTRRFPPAGAPMTDPRSAEREVPEVGTCLWANQICEQPNHHGCKTCLAAEQVRPRQRNTPDKSEEDR